MKLILATGVAAFLLLSDTDAVAHDGPRYVHDWRGHHRIVIERPRRMPAWLRHNRGFRAWFRHTPLRRYRDLSWRQLFAVYRIERRHLLRHAHRREPGDRRVLSERRGSDPGRSRQHRRRS